MPAFNEASCSRCHAKFSWQGELKDRPPCPKCGNVVSPAYMQAVEEKLEVIRERVLKGERHGKVESGDPGDSDSAP